MKTIKVFVAVPMMAVLAAVSARADLIWSEDFSDVSDWTVIFNAQSDASTLTSDGDLGLFYVESVNNEVAFGPNSGVSPFVPFDPNNKDDYTMSFVVDSLTASVSYDIRIDMFDAGNNYLGTVSGVVPQGTFVGTNTVNLGGYTYDSSTAQLMPKITVFTGPDFTDQTVRFDELRFDVVPEPSATLLMLLGAALIRGAAFGRSRLKARIG